MPVPSRRLAALPIAAAVALSGALAPPSGAVVPPRDCGLLKVGSRKAALDEHEERSHQADGRRYETRRESEADAHDDSRASARARRGP